MVNMQAQQGGEFGESISRNIPPMPEGHLPDDHSWQLVGNPMTGANEWVPLPIRKPVTNRPELEDEQQYRYYRGLESTYDPRKS